MAIRYPNGKTYAGSVNKRQANQRLPSDSYSKRGMRLEEDIDESNDFYLAQGEAVIHKKPTPVQIVHVDYPKRSAAVIREAYFKQASTTDYNGVYQGSYIDFEAKETKNKSSFPLKNFHAHQIDHMRQVVHAGGICFVLLCFSPTREVFLLDATHMIDFYDKQLQTRKSIPKSAIQKYGHAVRIGLHPRIHFLEIVKTVYFSGD
ncbi:Holliday junction resolvase RecU [Shouchella shacheensis]|uniref:Holliday junction resolvase RecU n=1 Tax=Shouchella shacheensis TaxID=1649580 RepID=UPI0007404104|nr:Holliday junction resolvase RecU [Shouchella shacheensis]